MNGVPEIAFVTQPTENPQLRQRYGLDEKDGGVLITSLSGFEKEKSLLKVGDVVISIDGQLVGNDNTVRFATADRIDSNILIARRQVGESLPLTIIREGKKMDINYPLTYTLKDSRIVPGHQSNLTPDYEVIGGLVVVEVNEDLMRGWKFVPPSIDMQRYEYRRTGSSETDRLLMVVSVLPDEINLGYEQTRFGVLKTVNSAPVSNLKQVREQMKKTDSDYVVLGFAPHDSQITFSRKALAERMPIIADRYGMKDIKPVPAATH